MVRVRLRKWASRIFIGSCVLIPLLFAGAILTAPVWVSPVVSYLDRRTEAKYKREMAQLLRRPVASVEFEAFPGRWVKLQKQEDVAKVTQWLRQDLRMPSPWVDLTSDLANCELILHFADASREHMKITSTVGPATRAVGEPTKTELWVALSPDGQPTETATGAGLSWRGYWVGWNDQPFFDLFRQSESSKNPDGSGVSE